MSKLNNIQEQITNLENEAQKIKLCEQKIGEYIFNLYEDGGIADGSLNMEIVNIINEVSVYVQATREHSIVGIWFKFYLKGKSNE